MWRKVMWFLFEKLHLEVMCDGNWYYRWVGRQDLGPNDSALKVKI